MKLISRIFLILLGIFLVNANSCLAKDSGDESIIPICEWKCELCGLEVFTFMPDDIGVKAGLQNKDLNHQQNNWLILKAKNPINKCSRASDGAHLFFRLRNSKTSPIKLADKLDRFIVLKNGGSSLKFSLNQIKCNNCGLEALCFDGDDLDMHDNVVLTSKLRLFKFPNRSSLDPCNFKLTRNLIGQAHIFLVKNKFTPSSSLQLADYLKNIIYSD